MGKSALFRFTDASVRSVLRQKGWAIKYEWYATAGDDALTIPEIAQALEDTGLVEDWKSNDKYIEELPVNLPMSWQICDVCQGDGKHSLHLGCITAEDRERDWDPDDFDNYMAGAYDKCCDTCDGSGKVMEINEQALSDKCKTLLEEWWNDEMISLAEQAAERRMGC